MTPAWPLYLWLLGAVLTGAYLLRQHWRYPEPTPLPQSLRQAGVLLLGLLGFLLLAWPLVWWWRWRER